MQQYNSATDSIKQENKSKLDTKLFVKMQTLAECTSECVKRVYVHTKGIKTTDLKFAMDKTWRCFLSNDHQTAMVQESLSQSSLGSSLHQISFPSIADTMDKEIVFPEVHRESTMVIGTIDTGDKSSWVFAYVHENISDAISLYSKHWTRYDPKLQTPTTALTGPEEKRYWRWV